MTGTAAGVSLRLAQEGIRKRAAQELRRASDRVQAALRILADAQNPSAPIVTLTSQEVQDGMAQADVILRSLARQLEHHGQVDMFGGIIGGQP